MIKKIMQKCSFKQILKKLNDKAEMPSFILAPQ